MHINTTSDEVYSDSRARISDLEILGIEASEHPESTQNEKIYSRSALINRPTVGVG